MDSVLLNNTSAIQQLIQKADELAQQPFGPGSKLSIVNGGQFSASNSNYVRSTTTTNDFGQNNNIIAGEVDEATVNQLIQSLSKGNEYYGNQTEQQFRTTTVTTGELTSSLSLAPHDVGEIFRDPNPPEIIRRPAQQGAVTYRQNVSVRFLQPPPVAPPGPLIIKEIRPPQPPPLPPLIIRQHAPPVPAPPPLILRERPPPRPAPVPPRTLIKQLPPIPVPPRSVIIERIPPTPARPRDIFIERWLPYSKANQKRRVIIQRAPPPRPYPQPRNAIVVYEPVQANVVRVVQRAGVQPENPQVYVDRFGHTLLDTGTLVTQVQQLGIAEDLSPLSSDSTQQYQSNGAEYYLGTETTTGAPEYEYSSSSWETQETADNERVQVYWIDPYEDVRVAMQRLGLV